MWLTASLSGYLNRSIELYEVLIKLTNPVEAGFISNGPVLRFLSLGFSFAFKKKLILSLTHEGVLIPSVMYVSYEL